MTSIIIPAYNADKYISETINSVLSQSYADWELIIVDDGSTDKTAEIVKQFCKKDNRIKYYYQKNSGVSVARNFGLNKAKGEYISFLDADDIWLNDFLIETTSFLEENQKIGVVNTNVRFINKNSEKLDILYSGVDSDCINDMLFFNLKNKTTGPSGTVCRKQFVNDINGFNLFLSNVADKMFYLDLSKVTEIKNIDKVLWLYRFHENSMHKNVDNIINDYESYIKQIELKRYIIDGYELKHFKKNIYKICLVECIKNKKFNCSYKYLKRFII